METSISVVILEDDPMVLELHRQYLSKVKGFNLTGWARDGEEGVNIIAKLQPHLAIVDIYMPGISGLDVLKHIRRQEWNTDVILVTAAHDTDSVQQGIQYGAVDYVIKPFTFTRFKKALETYRRYFCKLRTKEQLISQKDIDMLKNNIVGLSDKSMLPKGLQQTTLDLIVELLRQKNGYFTVKEIASALGISRVTVKRYLNYLQEGGILKGMLSYGPVGRPLQKFLVNKELINN
ncbi:response regulator receiver and unknown domain protein [Thermosinus carboxydivorans Nor1]|uniref:Transcriptional regulatory protein n=1 Tax=Thermosinus carboxydivorans Nor1 TaxID=401526 RepID=A1HPK0_9FIRM|nr:response regulator [Thermosinus carboxydivorans]EAX47973.1 response regulator receiver and unknown domain protein [Thermosinus carboxydivorans Nor1]